MSAPACVEPDMLDALLPMHMAVDAAGRVTGLGPTLARVAEERGVALLGRAFFEVAAVRRPPGIEDVGGLRAAAGRGLRVTLGDDLKLTGVAVPAQDAVLLNLSFGVEVVEAVARHRLTITDFAPTDHTADLLWLAEARAAAHRDLEALTRRVDAARRDAEAEAQADALTGLSNRRALDAVLAGLGGAGAAYTVLSVDLDLFKAVNDTYGHAAGDAVLCCAAERMRAAARRDDVVARTGGDEFVVVLRGDMPPERLAEVARGLIADIEAPVTLPDGATARISASIGTARSADAPGAAPGAVLAAADAALYRAKRAGRGRASA